MEFALSDRPYSPAQVCPGSRRHAGGARAPALLLHADGHFNGWRTRESGIFHITFNSRICGLAGCLHVLLHGPLLLHHAGTVSCAENQTQRPLGSDTIGDLQRARRF